jgi:signal transduction histidine kinase
MRVTLGRLRADERPDAHPAEPAAGLDRLDDLLTAVRAAGVPVDLVRTGTVAPLAPAVDHAAYRIVQESLTNVLKHAGRGATATVRLVYESGGTVEVAVTDDGAGGPAGTGGHGLTGMRERAESVGGTLAAGPTGHGFAVSARLPCGERS